MHEPLEAPLRKEVSSADRQIFLCDFGCSLLAGERVACWGAASWTADTWANATVLPGFAGVVDIDLVGAQLCRLTAGGAVKCTDVLDGPGGSASRTPLDGLSGVVEIETAFTPPPRRDPELVLTCERRSLYLSTPPSCSTTALKICTPPRRRGHLSPRRVRRRP
jgi:hypothetical protein